MSPSSAASDGLLVTKVASLGPPLLGAALLTALYTETATTASVITRWRARDSAADAEPMCALSGRQSWLGEEKTPTRLEASPSILGVMPSRGEVPRQGRKPLARPRKARGASPGLESLVLSEVFRSCVVGLGRPAHGTLVPIVPTVAPGPTMGTPETSTEAKRRGPKRRMPGPRHVERDSCARDHDLLGFNGRCGGTRHYSGGGQ